MHSSISNRCHYRFCRSYFSIRIIHYVEEKVKKWVDDTVELSQIAIEEPQIALPAYTKSICHRWSFIQRTIGGISHLFHPIENCIKETFLPALIGRKVSDSERRIFALPVRHGGLGIANPVETCEREYQSSLAITEDLTGLIYRQEHDLFSILKGKLF